MGFWAGVQIPFYNMAGGSARGDQSGSPPPGAADDSQNFGTARSPHREDGGHVGGYRHQEDVGRQPYEAGPLEDGTRQHP